ncbi:MAG: glutathione S-transferase N-terminal domain-containing protein [Gallionella sp.]|jgi:glutathione S-transferase
MKLLGTHTSPYVRKARLVLLEKNIPHEYVIDPPSEPGSLVLQVNPLGRIPALILDDGFCVFDSSVIAGYADTLNDAPVLIPRTDPLARLRVKRWEALADGIMDSAIVVRNESLRAEDKQNQAVQDMHNLAVTHALDYAAQLLGEREWCEGDAITLADLALVSALLYLDLRQAARDWRSAHANLAVWLSRISARPSVIVSNRL